MFQTIVKEKPSGHAVEEQMEQVRSVEGCSSSDDVSITTGMLGLDSSESCKLQVSNFGESEIISALERLPAFESSEDVNVDAHGLSCLLSEAPSANAKPAENNISDSELLSAILNQDS